MLNDGLTQNLASILLKLLQQSMRHGRICGTIWGYIIRNYLRKDLFLAKITEIQYTSFHVKCNLCKILSGNWGFISGSYSSFCSRLCLRKFLGCIYFVAKIYLNNDYVFYVQQFDKRTIDRGWIQFKVLTTLPMT